ncbi:MAG: hypothetical protein WCP55_07910 [Lentisphaerota bacterium]
MTKVNVAAILKVFCCIFAFSNVANAAPSIVEDGQPKAQIVDLRRAWLAKLSGEKPLNLHDNYSSGGDSPFPVYYPHLIAAARKAAGEDSIYVEYIFL